MSERESGVVLTHLNLTLSAAVDSFCTRVSFRGNDKNSAIPPVNSKTNKNDRQTHTYTYKERERER